jgi:hypothetical protein
MAKDTKKQTVRIFKRRINPAFHRHPQEGIAIGRMIASFGELEVMMAMLAARCSSGHYISIMRALYRLRATSTRIAQADVFIKPIAKHHGLSEEYTETLAAVENCREIRNRYAHAQWGDDPKRPGLYFTDFQRAAAGDEGFSPMHFHVGAAILRAQGEYFVYAQDWLFYLEHELALRAGRSKGQPFGMPPKRAPPIAHNDPRKYVPQWLSSDERALHLERARAIAEGVPAPTPKQKALSAAIAKKRAEKAVRDRRSQERDPKRKHTS